MKTWTYYCLACLWVMLTMAHGYQFSVWQSPELPKGQIEQDGKRFKLSMMKTAGTRNYTIAIGNTPDVQVPSQYKLAFKIRGGKLNRNTWIGVHILTDPGDGKKWITHRAGEFSGDSQDWRTVVMGLDSDFHLADATWKVVQVKFHLNGDKNPNSYSEIEVKDIRFVSAEELGPEGVNYIVKMNQRLKMAMLHPIYASSRDLLEKPVAVYFDLDNEDMEAFIPPKNTEKVYHERNLDSGFRGLLMRGMDNRYRGQGTVGLEVLLPNEAHLMELVEKAEDADVIVYSRAKADSSVKHVLPDKKMIVFGPVADDDVKAVLPVELTYLDAHDYAARKHVKLAKKHPIFEKEKLNSTAFGVYYDLKLKSGAKRILDFEDGKPCVVERKGVIYAATGLGTQLLPDSFYYDRFLLKAILYLAGREKSFARMDANKAALEEYEQQEVEKYVEHTKISTPESLSGTWRMGMSHRNFGRFGYGVGEGLLCCSLRKDLGVENGAQAFRLDVPSPMIKAEAGPSTLEVENVSWTGKRMKLTNGGYEYYQEVSLLSPFVRYDFLPRTMDLSLENVAEYAVFQTGLDNDFRQVRLADKPDFYVHNRDGNLKQPWVLLYRPGEQCPVLMVFDSSPTQMTARVEDGSVTGIRFTCGHGQGFLLCGWPFGSRPVDTSNWIHGLPEQVVIRLDLMARMALSYPSACGEIYKVDRDAKKVRIIQRTHHRWQRNEWDIPKFEYGVMPPLMAFADEEGILVSRNLVDNDSPAEGVLVNLQTPTRFGPMKAVLGRPTLTYSIDLPNVEADIMTPGYKANDGWLKEANDAFAGGVKWSWGGGAKYEIMRYDSPNAYRGGDNMNPFGWHYGLSTALQGYFMLNKENRAKLRERVNHRYIEALEQYQYKAFARHRVEPFSGLAYPVMFRSIYPLGVNYAEGEGTKFNYGDCNEASILETWVGELLANRFGMKSLIQANWPFYKYNVLHQKVMDDWAYHAGSCRENGAGAWIDMLNGEYAGMVCHARLAAMMGDIAEEDDAIYRAAKRIVPTLIRLRYHKYLGEPDDMTDAKRTLSLITGFGEYGAKTYPKPLQVNSNVLAAMDLFDFSQGAPGSLFRLYMKYALAEVQSYMEMAALPALVGKDGFRSNGRYIQPIAYFMTPAMKLEEWTNDVIELKRKSWTLDWPGMTAAYPLALAMWRKTAAPMVTVCKEADVKEMMFDVEKRRLDMTIDATEQTEMELSAPKSLKVNGKHVGVLEETIRLPLKKGENRVEALY